jgi:hypothetical protein
VLNELATAALTAVRQIEAADVITAPINNRARRSAVEHVYKHVEHTQHIGICWLAQALSANQTRFKSAVHTLVPGTRGALHHMGPTHCQRHTHNAYTIPQKTFLPLGAAGCRCSCLVSCNAWRLSANLARRLLVQAACSRLCQLSSCLRRAIQQMQPIASTQTAHGHADSCCCCHRCCAVSCCHHCCNCSSRCSCAWPMPQLLRPVCHSTSAATSNQH